MRPSSPDCAALPLVTAIPSPRERRELAGTKVPRDLIEHGIDHPGLVLVDEGVGDIDVFGDDNTRRNVVAMPELIGACTQHRAQDCFDPFERPSFGEDLVDQRIKATLLAHPPPPPIPKKPPPRPHVFAPS